MKKTTILSIYTTVQHSSSVFLFLQEERRSKGYDSADGRTTSRRLRRAVKGVLYLAWQAFFFFFCGMWEYNKTLPVEAIPHPPRCRRLARHCCHGAVTHFLFCLSWAVGELTRWVLCESLGGFRWRLEGLPVYRGVVLSLYGGDIRHHRGILLL